MKAGHPPAASLPDRRRSVWQRRLCRECLYAPPRALRSEAQERGATNAGGGLGRPLRLTGPEERPDRRACGALGASGVKRGEEKA